MNEWCGTICKIIGLDLHFLLRKQFTCVLCACFCSRFKCQLGTDCERQYLGLLPLLTSPEQEQTEQNMDPGRFRRFSAYTNTRVVFVSQCGLIVGLHPVYWAFAYFNSWYIWDVSCLYFITRWSARRCPWNLKKWNFEEKISAHLVARAGWPA